MPFTHFLRDNLLDQVWGNDNYSQPINLYVGLSSSTPTEAGGNVTEPSAVDGYARVEVANNLTNWPEAVDGYKANATEIEFPEATGNWGTITHFTIYDTSTGGNLLAFGNLTTSRTIQTNDTARFQGEDLEIEMIVCP